MINNNILSIIFISIFFIFIVCISIWAISKSKTINCCSNKSNFQNCRAYFKNGANMKSDNIYKQICKK
jgi:hypothetical protein